MVHGYLNTGVKAQCSGCSACVQACPFGALAMEKDAEGFGYPVLDAELCRDCGLCHRACPMERPPALHDGAREVFGGHHVDAGVLAGSTSGGAFTALVQAWFDRPGDRVVWGAVAHGLEVRHECAASADDAAKFRKSKYSQSDMGLAYREIRKQLSEGWSVLFSGTPCQVAGLYAYLGNSPSGELLTVEVICEGVPSPHYIQKYAKRLEARYKTSLETLDYRDKDGRKWDFQVMSASLESGHHFKVDRWFNPYWSIWLQHLMNRPSCYTCSFARPERVADISLGDLWGVHIYCPDLYNGNAGASLVVCSTEAGVALLGAARSRLSGRGLPFEDALRYQGPMRRPVGWEPRRGAFMRDLLSMDIDELERKWAKRPTIRLLASKYLWGNRQKVTLWKIRERIRTSGKGRDDNVLR